MKKHYFKKIVGSKRTLFLLVTILIVAVLICSLFVAKNLNNPTVKLGYFHGGRTTILFRAFVYGYFDNEKLNVQLITKNLYEDNYFVIPKDPNADNQHAFGKATGEELVQGIIDGKFDGAAIGGDSFITEAAKHAPIVAVANLGHDIAGEPGHVILFRSGVVINKPSDIKGKTLATRRAGPGDYARLAEFLKSVGIDPQKDVTIIKNMPDDQMYGAIENGTIDGGFFHVMGAGPLVKNNYAYVYKTLNWINPALVSAVLVFRTDFVKKNPKIVEAFVYAYMKRIKYEHSLTEAQKRASGKLHKGLQMETSDSSLDSQAVNLPQYDFPPLLSLDLLNDDAQLLLENHDISTTVNLTPYIDNSFVNKVYAEIK